MNIYFHDQQNQVFAKYFNSHSTTIYCYSYAKIENITIISVN